MGAQLIVVLAGAAVFAGCALHAHRLEARMRRGWQNGPARRRR